MKATKWCVQWPRKLNGFYDDFGVRQTTGNFWHYLWFRHTTKSRLSKTWTAMAIMTTDILLISFCKHCVDTVSFADFSCLVRHPCATMHSHHLYEYRQLKLLTDRSHRLQATFISKIIQIFHSAAPDGTQHWQPITLRLYQVTKVWDVSLAAGQLLGTISAGIWTECHNYR